MVFTLARFLSGGAWLLGGLYMVTHFKQTRQVMSSKGVPAASFFTVLTLVIQLGGAIMVFSNNYVWLTALVWIAFTILATPLYHGKFIENGTIVFAHYTQVGKNLSLIGGLLALAALDPALPTILRTFFV
jgi:uncharacterized membrane protein YphA (DoxX/SURF4 family)